MADYKGSPCKTPGCGGHKAGAKYVRNGGGTPSPHSDSFNNGMNIQQTPKIKHVANRIVAAIKSINSGK